MNISHKLNWSQTRRDPVICVPETKIIIHMYLIHTPRRSIQNTEKLL